MPLAAGARLGSYEIVSTLGAGGMGEVYRARDHKLGRDVAIKILPPALADDPDRRARLEREARTLASINHPHIASIYGLEDAGTAPALILELVEGETLHQRLAGGPMPVTDALIIGEQIADALEAAHHQGIVHRDLKPANIKVTPAGNVKVLDFGLAKAIGVNRAEAPTISRGGTRDGVILGTASYMSPEQARGQPVDKRADIWAFGCVLFELLTGRVAFPGDTFSDAIAAILERSPDWTELPSTTPLSVRQLIARCLEKQHKERLRDIGDARLELREALAPSERNRVVQLRGASVLWRWIAGTLVVAGVLLMASRISVDRVSEPGVPIRLNLAFDGFTWEGTGTPVPSPDGKNFVVQAFDAAGQRLLWLRPLESGTARPLPGTLDGEQPFWFPDGQSVGFFAQGKLRRVGISGGSPQNIADAPDTPGDFSNGVAVNERGDIIFSAGNRGPLSHFRQSDGATRPLTRLDSSRAENSHRFPIFLPDGRRFLFVARSAQRENNALYLGSIDSAEMRRIMPLHSNVAYLAPRPGRSATLVYVRDGTLVEQRFDGNNVSGEPSEIVDGVEYIAASLLARFRVSADGSVLIFRPAGAGRNQLRWFDRKGTPLAPVGPPGPHIQPRISPDGGRVLVSQPDAQAGTRDLWYFETSRGVANRLTTAAANDWYPVWAPDGASLLFSSDREGGPLMTLFQKRSMEPGVGESKRLAVATPAGAEAVPEDWSSDGRWVAFSIGAGLPLRDVWVASTDGDWVPSRLLASAFSESNPRFSPDGRWIAYVSNESGRFEVYVRQFAGGSLDAAAKHRVSTAGGDFPVWRRDGRELYFIGGDLRLYTVPTTDLGRTASVPEPQALFRPCQGTVLAGLPMRATTWDHPYDISPDGQQFLVNCLSVSPDRFDVMLNWTRSFK